MSLPQIDTVIFVWAKIVRVFRGFTHFLSPSVDFFLTGSWDAVILTDFVVGILLVEVGGRLRRPFRGGAFLRTSASPRGGAMIALPLHGIYGAFLSVFR